MTKIGSSPRTAEKSPKSLTKKVGVWNHYRVEKIKQKHCEDKMDVWESESKAGVQEAGVTEVSYSVSRGLHLKFFWFYNALTHILQLYCLLSSKTTVSTPTVKMENQEKIYAVYGVCVYVCVSPCVCVSVYTYIYHYHPLKVQDL